MGEAISTLVLKPSKSFIGMGSMELVNTEKLENKRCGHFTIR